MKVQIVAYDSQLEPFTVASAHVTGRSVAEFRRTIELEACRRFGREGRDWRMVPDSTLFGMHAREIRTGETLELR
jgi:hypothetical protein